MKSVFKPLLASVLFLILTASGCNNAPGDVVSVTISGGAQSVHKGAFTHFSAAGAGTSGVIWTVVDTDKHQNTSIDSTGLLFIAQGEKKTSLTVKAVSVSNPAVSETVSISIPAAAARVDMGAQPIYPLQGHADMLPGDYRLLTAYNLVDPYETGIEWEWEIIGTVDSQTKISIDSVGWFRDPEKDVEPNEEEEIAVTSATIEISENETMGNVFMIKATHPYDPSVFGYATVSVRRPSVTQVTLETEQIKAAPGDTVTIMVSVIGTGTIPEEDGNVLLSISGNTSAGTKISEYDRGWGGAELTIAADETAQFITVTAISEKNPGIYGDITVDL